MEPQTPQQPNHIDNPPIQPTGPTTIQPQAYNPAAQPQPTITPPPIVGSADTQAFGRPSINNKTNATQQIIDGNFGPGNPQKKKIVVSGIVVAIIITIGIGGFLYMSQKDTSRNSQSIASSPAEQIDTTTASSGNLVKTDYGFTLMAPDKWEKTTSQAGTVNGLIEDTISISPPLSFSYEPEEPDERNAFVAVGTSKLSNGSGKDDFEKRVSVVNEEDLKLLENFGYSKDEYKIVSKKIELNGREWLLVDSELPNELTRKLYSWDNDKAIFFSIKAESKEQLEKFSNKFLYPMASSIKFNQ